MSYQDDATGELLADDTLRAFYRALCDRAMPLTVPVRLEVEDLEATLSRVWDLGGTIVSISAAKTGDGSSPAATFADPRGNLVTIVQWNESAAV
jgi:predicted enzyme related to lactoylglutathione lyase